MTEEQGYFWLKQKMIGSAQSFVELQTEEVKANYDQLVIVLGSYFKDTTSITMHYMEAFSCAPDMKENESIRYVASSANGSLTSSA